MPTILIIFIILGIIAFSIVILKNLHIIIPLLILIIGVPIGIIIDLIIFPFRFIYNSFYSIETCETAIAKNVDRMINKSSRTLNLKRNKLIKLENKLYNLKVDENFKQGIKICNEAKKIGIL